MEGQALSRKRRKICWLLPIGKDFKATESLNLTPGERLYMLKTVGGEAAKRQQRNQQECN